ncbi:hydantoinase B/oxoprolinase family protein, partial [Arthrospira platensis SPKY1]|nr:hydantoinase B/oxoprolinase family protein [Arthrospira platensis SPKY1]
MGAKRHLILQKQKKEAAGAQSFREHIALELFFNRFTAIAEEMGAQLQRTSFSVNIKER